MCPGVEMVRSLADMWAEFMTSPHERVRVLVDTQSGKAQVDHGMDSKKCASFKRAHFYAEDAEHSGLIWLDLVPGGHTQAIS